MSTFNEVPPKVNFSEEEEKTLAYWKKIDAFQQSLERSKGKPEFSFYDGPPFATGLPHYGHILTGTMKDIVTRFAHQTGHHVERRFGWDTHGLPVEFEIDKALNIKTRKDVLAMGIDKYNEECRKIVMKYASEWRTTIERTGRWIDFDNDYKTLDLSFMESLWWVFKELFNKGLVYRAFKVMPYSTACNTPLSNFESQLNYKEDVQDPSIVVSFPIINNENTHFLAWTTTPWTLPSNLALCVRKSFTYVKVKAFNRDVNWIIAECRLPWLCQQLKLDIETQVTIIEKMTGEDLIGLRYIPLFNYFNVESNPLSKTAFRVVADDYVTDSSGTGIVHQAPAFGEDDYRVCNENKVFVLDAAGRGLPCPLDFNGCFTNEVSDFEGVYVKDADKEIKTYLNEKNRLIINSTFTHNYPYCWRSDTPLIYRAIPSWFINVEAIKTRLLANNQTTRWVPDGVREGRFQNWLENAQDWCVSRNRYWGTPLPLWVSEDYDEIVCIGSVEELEKHTDKKITDIHRHFIDDIVIKSEKTGKELRRIDEVFDCWFESGSMPYGQLHYPFENKEKFEKTFPADFIGEGLDQTRGWFYTLMVIGTALFDKAPFKNLIVNGLVLATDGKKMSKRLKNYPDPLDIINQYGADALRLYLINSPVVHAETLRFKEEGVKDIIRDCFLPLFNSYRFLLQEVQRFESVNGAKWNPNMTLAYNSVNPLDKWIIAATHNLIQFFHQEMNAYKLYTVVPKLLEYLDSLTNWYLRFNRDRMRGINGQQEAMTCLSILYEVIFTLVRLLAPFTPFLSEYLYQNLKLALPESEQEDSVHFTFLPYANEKLIDANVELRVQFMKKVIECGRCLREKAKVGLKTPLSKLTVIHQDQSFLDAVAELESYVTDQLNVIEVEYSDDDSLLLFSALPNNQKLGKQFGKKFGLITKEVRSLSSKTLAEFVRKCKQNSTEKPFIVVCDEKLYEDDLIIQINAASTSNANIKSHSDQSVAILLDFTPDEKLEAMSISREVVNNIQKLRKESSLQPEDNVQIFVSSSEETILNALTTQAEYLEKLLRRNVHVGKTMDSTDVEKDGFKFVLDGTFEVQEKLVSAKILKKF